MWDSHAKRLPKILGGVRRCDKSLHISCLRLTSGIVKFTIPVGRGDGAVTVSTAW